MCGKAPLFRPTYSQIPAATPPSLACTTKTGRLSNKTARFERSVIYLNGRAYEALGCPGSVELIFDGNRRIIGVKPTDRRHSNAFPVVHHPYNYYRISAAAFCQHFRIKPRATMLFQNVDLDPEGVMTLDLMNTVTVTRGAR